METLTIQRPELHTTTADDIVELRAMQAQAWRDTYPNEENGVPQAWVEQRTDAWLTPEGIERSKDHLKDILDSPEHFHQIARQDGKVVGMVHMSKADGGQTLAALYTDKTQHGTGLAQRLMDEGLAWCDNSQPIDLEVATYNERAKAFYRKYGFEEKAGSGQLFADRIPVVMMEKKGENDEV